MNPKHSYSYFSSNPSSLKSKFTRGFLRALIKIKRRPTTTSASPRDIFQRCRTVKIAADKSLALAVGSRRAWSRALLWKIQYKAWRYRANSVRRIYNIHPMMRNKKHIKEIQKKKKKKKKKNSDEEVGFCHAKELRKLVPGGEAMDLCSLLEETAHYIECLVTQVQVMRSIDEFYSI